MNTKLIIAAAVEDGDIVLHDGEEKVLGTTRVDHDGLEFRFTDGSRIYGIDYDASVEVKI